MSPSPEVSVDARQCAGRLAAALRFATVSREEPEPSAAGAFRAFHAFLAEAFPAVHASLCRETVGDLGLLYVWPGSNEALQPVLLLAHQDVVPVSPETEADWAHPPFAGEVADGQVWGRGALDDKSSLMAILEAVEALLREGLRPQRTVYLAFGQDEEVGGAQGAARIAQLLRERGVRLAFVLDEGGFIAEGVVPAMAVPVALVGIAEKGYLTLELTVEGAGGHSAMPERSTPIGVLSRALLRLEANPFPADLSFIVRFFAAIAAKFPFPRRVALRHPRLFAPWLTRRLARSPQMNALIRTTTAPTMLSAGVKENVLPVAATAVVNFRVMPGEKTAGVVERVQQIVADPRVQIRQRPLRSEPSPVSDVHSASYALLERTIRQTVAAEKPLVAPYLVVGATDSRHFNDLAKNIYRFSPIRVGAEDLSGR